MPGTVPKQSKRGYKKKSNPPEPIKIEPSEPSDETKGLKYARRVWPENEGVKAGEVISFTWYYVKLRVRVITGQHQTSHSLSVKYRWHNWQHWQRSKRS